MKAEEDFIELSNYKGEKVFVCYAPSENKYIVKEKEMVLFSGNIEGLKEIVSFFLIR